jgi:hypothetical protein
MTNENNERVEISECRADSGQLALGVAFSPTSATDDEVHRLNTKIAHWVEQVRTGHLTRQEAWHCLQTTVMKTINYCLPASVLSKKDFETIMTPLLRIGLPKAGICRTMARSVVFGSVSHQGLGIQNPFWMQGIYKLYLLLDRSQEMTQQLIDVSWAKMVTETGLGPDFWTYDVKDALLLATPGWIRTLWEFLIHTEGIQVQRMDGLRKRQSRFNGDHYIMRMVLILPGVARDNIRTFNYCRLFLQVELLSDLLTADGQSVRYEIWKGLHNITPPPIAGGGLNNRVQVNLPGRYGAISYNFFLIQIIWESGLPLSSH